VIRFERAPDASLDAVASVHVGLTTSTIRVPLGPWFATAPDPAGLANTPVVALPDPRWTELARMGALRAGRQPPVLLLPASVPSIGGQLLVAVAEGVEVVLVPGGGRAALVAGRALRGRAILALPLDDERALQEVLTGLDVDVHLPIPSIDGPARARIRDAVFRHEPERLHHLVEVDPGPALATVGLRIDEATDGALAAAAAGVLAGRLSAGNRRWREPVT
jgi:hypothetical protein